MKKECLFYFKLNKDGDKKLLRANFMLDQNAEPAVADFIRCFHRLGYETELSGRLSLTFRTTNTTPAYFIEVTKVNIIGETEETPFIDWERQAILKELMQLNT